MNVGFAVMGALLMALVAVAPTAPPGSQCAKGGYWVGDGALCNASTFNAQMTEALGNTYDKYYPYGPDPVSGLHDSGRRTATTTATSSNNGASSSGGGGSSSLTGGPLSSSADPYSVAALLYAHVCPEWDIINNNCVEPDSSMWPIVTDWQQPRGPYYPGVNSELGTSVFFSGPPEGSAANGMDTPLSTWDWVGAGPGAGNATMPFEVTFVDARLLPRGANGSVADGSAAGVNGLFVAGQRTVASRATSLMNTPCAYAGEGVVVRIPTRENMGAAPYACEHGL